MRIEGHGMIRVFLTRRLPSRSIGTDLLTSNNFSPGMGQTLRAEVSWFFISRIPSSAVRNRIPRTLSAFSTRKQQFLGRFACWGNSLEKTGDRKSTRLNSSHVEISYAVFCLKK